MNNVALAGRASGPLDIQRVVRSGQTEVHRAVFVGGEPGHVDVTRDVDSELALQVHEVHNNPVCDNDLCSFIPPYTAQFRIEVRNVGAGDVHYRLRTN